MATRKPLVLGASGHPEQLQSGDSLAGVGGGGLATVAVDCDFGSTPASSKTFDAADAGALEASSAVLVWLSGSMPAGVFEDELELDPIEAHGWVPADGTVRLRLTSVNGSPVTGKRRVIYALV